MTLNIMPVVTECFDSRYLESTGLRGSGVTLEARITGATRDGCRRLVRIPGDLFQTTDSKLDEIADFDLLEQYFYEFLPNPRVVNIEYNRRSGRKVFDVVECDEVESPFLRQDVRSDLFVEYFKSLSDADAKVRFLLNLKAFIERCKLFFAERECVLDLVGRGNLIPFGDSLMILDINRVFEVPQDYMDEIPLGFDGIAFYDHAVNFLYELEFCLLNGDGDNISQDPFYAVLKDVNRRRAVRKSYGPWYVRMGP